MCACVRVCVCVRGCLNGYTDTNFCQLEHKRITIDPTSARLFIYLFIYLFLASCMLTNTVVYPTKIKHKVFMATCSSVEELKMKKKKFFLIGYMQIYLLISEFRIYASLTLRFAYKRVFVYGSVFKVVYQKCDMTMKK